jgi:two-component system cell cycle sensor histidine kinase/response regulator CckA
MRIRFPRAEENDVAPDPPVQPIANRRGTERILLVEDDDSVRELVSRMLIQDHYTVLTAADGEEAIRISSAEPGPIHVLVTDVLLPGMTGTELARKLGEQRPDLRVLFLSGYAPESARLDLATFLQKPFTEEALSHKLRLILDRPITSSEQPHSRGHAALQP